MGVFGRIFTKRPDTHESVVVGLTPLGAAKAESLAGPSGIKGQILLTLKDAGPSSLGDIAEETHISFNRVQPTVKSLLACGYVRKVSGGD